MCRFVVFFLYNMQDELWVKCKHAGTRLEVSPHRASACRGWNGSHRIGSSIKPPNIYVCCQDTLGGGSGVVLFFCAFLPDILMGPWPPGAALTLQIQHQTFHHQTFHHHCLVMDFSSKGHTDFSTLNP